MNPWELPVSIGFNGVEFPIRTDFRDILELEHMLSCGETDALIRCVLFFYRKIHPVDLEFAMDSMLDFYRCGQKPKPPIPGASKERAFAYEQDALLFYAAFLEQYGIDLYETSYLHWWKFRALTDGLSPETQLSRVMGYRTANTAKMSKDMRPRPGRALG